MTPWAANPAATSGPPEVCDLVDEIGLAQSMVSEHLRILEAAGIIVGEIERPRVCYSLNPTALEPLRQFLATATPRGRSRVFGRG